METLISIIRQHIEDYPDKALFTFKEMGSFRDVTWRRMGRIIDLLGCALIDVGVKMGDRVAILSENRPEWAYADLSILSCGAVTVPVYATNTAGEIEYILKETAAEIIFVSSKDKLDRVLSIISRTCIKRVISFQKVPSIDPLVTTFDNFLFLGKESITKHRRHLIERGKAVRAEDLVTIIYTSGSTGLPKGVMLTNANLITNCRTCARLMDVGPNDNYLSFLPLSHVFERMAGHYMHLIQGGRIAYAESGETILADAKAVSPTLMCGVPRFFEKIYAGIMNRAIRGNPIGKNIFFWGYRVGKACFLRRQRGRRVPKYLLLQKRLITAPISKKIKRLFGGRLRFFISGGAPLSKEVAYFFLSFGILLLEGYGLTESSPVISVNRPDDYKIGTVGKPIDAVTVRIAPDGEILVKGPNVMKGYYHLYEDTQKTIKDGWLYTGDIGYLDKDGFLVITDRKKDIIITSGGKNIAPSEIETIIKADRYIDDILIYGDRKKYLTALVIPNFENIRDYAAFKKIGYKRAGGLAGDKRVRDFIRRRIEEKQADQPRFARIKKFIILDKELTRDAGELTPTLKIKRRLVTKKYKKALDALYEKDIK